MGDANSGLQVCSAGLCSILLRSARHLVDCSDLTYLDFVPDAGPFTCICTCIYIYIYKFICLYLGVVCVYMYIHTHIRVCFLRVQLDLNLSSIPTRFLNICLPGPKYPLLQDMHTQVCMLSNAVLKIPRPNQKMWCRLQVEPTHA